MWCIGACVALVYGVFGMVYCLLGVDVCVDVWCMIVHQLCFSFLMCLSWCLKRMSFSFAYCGVWGMVYARWCNVVHLCCVWSLARIFYLVYHVV